MCIYLQNIIYREYINNYYILQHISKTLTDFIPKYRKQNDLEVNLNNEIKNKKSEEENKKLKLDLERYKKENEKLKLDLDEYKKENEKLKSNLVKAKKIISGIGNTNQTSNNGFKKLMDENNRLKNEKTKKENEIKDLKTKLQKNQSEDIKVNYKDIMVVNFIQMDSTVHFGVKCLPTDVFAEVEEKLYKRYDNLRNTNNMFTSTYSNPESRCMPSKRHDLCSCSFRCSPKK